MKLAITKKLFVSITICVHVCAICQRYSQSLQLRRATGDRNMRNLCEQFEQLEVFRQQWTVANHYRHPRHRPSIQVQRQVELRLLPCLSRAPTGGRARRVSTPQNVDSKTIILIHLELHKTCNRRVVLVVILQINIHVKSLFENIKSVAAKAI